MAGITTYTGYCGHTGRPSLKITCIFRINDQNDRRCQPKRRGRQNDDCPRAVGVLRAARLQRARRRLRPAGKLVSSWVDTDQLCDINLSHVLVTPSKTSGVEGPTPPMTRAIVETPVPNLDLVGGDIKLTNFDREPDDAAYRLRNELLEHGAGYDLVFLDCPPQLGKLLTAALIAANHVLIVCAASALGLEGLSELAYTIKRVKSNVNRELDVLGAVINLYMPRRRLSRSAREAVEAATEMVGHVFATNVHNLTEIGEAPTARAPVAVMAPSSKAAHQLSALTDEFLGRLNLLRGRPAGLNRRGDGGQQFLAGSGRELISRSPARRKANS